MNKLTLKMMIHAWQGYMMYAKGFDELDSERKMGYNWYSPNSMLFTPIDAYDTLWIMDLKNEAAEAKNLIFANINFDIDKDVSMFETTIRVLGGLLSSYEMDGDRVWIRHANELGIRLLPSFNSPHGLPVDSFNMFS